MRRKDREVKQPEEIEKIIKKCRTIRIGMAVDSKPFIVPVNFGFTLIDNNFIFYIHSAKKGHKVDLWKENPNIAFEMDVEIGLNPGPKGCDYGFFYESVIGHGEIVKIEDFEMQQTALNEIMLHQTGSQFEFAEKNLNTVNIYKIKVTDIVGKRCVPKE